MESIDIFNLILGFLGTGIGISLLVYFYRQGQKLAEKTENKVDDVLLEILPEAADKVIENFELGQAETILEKWLQKLNKSDEDTQKAEAALEVKKSEIKKQQ